MHEFSICESLVKALLEEVSCLGTPPPRVREVNVKAGTLQAIVPENLELAFEVLTRETAAEGARINIDIVPVRLSCTDCGWNGPTDDGVYICAACGSRNVEVTEGRELHLVSLEVDSRDNANH